MLNVTRRELERAFRWHRDHCGNASTAPLRLLLCYAVECGTKALLMKTYRVESYSELPTDARIVHDFPKGLLVLRAPVPLHQISKITVTTTHNQPPQQNVPPKDLHQAFRYGIPIDVATPITAELQNILGWLKERLG
jgi:hypothetical protein